MSHVQLYPWLVVVVVLVVLVVVLAVVGGDRTRAGVMVGLRVVGLVVTPLQVGSAAFVEAEITSNGPNLSPIARSTEHDVWRPTFAVLLPSGDTSFSSSQALNLPLVEIVK